MDALTLLTADHNRVRGLFSQFRQAEQAEDSARLSSIGTRIADELAVHTTIEEEIFYPWVSGVSEELAKAVGEGIQEHHQVKVLLAEASELEATSDRWIAKFTVIIEDVEHHAEEEESEMFPKVRAATSVADREPVGEKLDMRKGQLGAPVLADTIDLTDAALHELATAQEIPGRSKMDHDELAATVNPA